MGKVLDDVKRILRVHRDQAQGVLEEVESVLKAFGWVDLVLDEELEDEEWPVPRPVDDLSYYPEEMDEEEAPVKAQKTPNRDVVRQLLMEGGQYTRPTLHRALMRRGLPRGSASGVVSMMFKEGELMVDGDGLVDFASSTPAPPQNPHP